MGLYGRGVGDAVYESLVHALIDLVVTREPRVKVGGEGEEVVDGDVRGRYGVGDT